MLSHRFQHLLNKDDSEFSRTQPCNLSFVAMPIAVQQTMTAIQLAQIEYLYRLAFERAHAQVAAEERNQFLDFSIN